MDGIATALAIAIGALVERAVLRRDRSNQEVKSPKLHIASERGMHTPDPRRSIEAFRHATAHAAEAGSDHSLVGTTVEFAYTGNDGVVTHRIVMVTSVFRYSGTIYIRGQCRLREAERTFRRDRVVGDIVEVGSADRVKRIVVGKRRRRSRKGPER